MNKTIWKKFSSGKNIIVLSTCMALQMTSFVMILPLFAQRFNELNAGVKDLGISSMAFYLTATLAAPFMGGLADRFGRRPLVLVSLVVYVAAFVGYLFAASAAAFIVIRGLAGAFTAGLIPAVTGLAADMAPADRRAQWIGFMNAGASTGWVAGPVAGGLIYDRWGYSTALIAAILMALVTLLAAVLWIHEVPYPARQPLPGSTRRGAVSLVRRLQELLLNLRSSLPQARKSFSILLLIFFSVLFAWSFIEPRFMFYAYNDLGWSSSRLGLAMSVYGIALVFGELLFGRLSDRLGRKPVILAGLALFSAQFIGLAFFKSYFLLAGAFLVAGFGNSLYDPALSASILDISPAEHRARILGIKSMVGSLGSILGYALVAAVSASMDARSIFLIAVGIVCVTWLTGMALSGSQASTREEVPLDGGSLPAAAEEVSSSSI